MPEDLDGAACDERRAPEQLDAQLLRRAERVRDAERNSHRRFSAGDLPDEIEHARLWRVLAAELVSTADDAAFERRAVAGRNIVYVRVRPRILGTDQPRQTAFQMIRDQASDEIAFGERSGTVDHARIDANDRAAVLHAFIGETIGGELRALIVIGGNRLSPIARCEGHEGRGIQDARHALSGGGVEHVAQSADVDLVEILAAAAPDADERRRVCDGVASDGGALERGPIANVAIDENAGQATACRRAREDHEVVSASRQREDHGATEIPGASGDEHFHWTWRRQ